jgi:hypothetical protein
LEAVGDFETAGVVVGDRVGDSVGDTVVVGDTVTAGVVAVVVGASVGVNVGVTVGNIVGETVGEALGPTLAHPHSSNAAIVQITIAKIIVFFKAFASFVFIFDKQEAFYKLQIRIFCYCNKSGLKEAAVADEFPQYAVLWDLVVIVAGEEIIQKLDEVIGPNAFRL